MLFGISIVFYFLVPISLLVLWLIFHFWLKGNREHVYNSTIALVGVLAYGWGVVAVLIPVNEEVTYLSPDEYNFSKTDRYVFVSYDDLTYETDNVWMYNNIGTDQVTVKLVEKYNSYNYNVKEYIKLVEIEDE